MQNNQRLQELYAVALDVFSEYGYKKATVEEIASRMDLTKGAIYQYVENKKDLYDKAVGESMLKWHNKVVIAIKAEKTTEKKFIAMCQSAFYYLEEDKTLKAILVKDPDIYPMSFKKDPYRKLNEKSMLFIKDILDKGIQEGKIRPTDTTIMTKFLFSVYKMIVITTYLLEEEDAKKIIDIAIETITNGLYERLTD